jgi:hypothetical protein
MQVKEIDAPTQGAETRSGGGRINLVVFRSRYPQKIMLQEESIHPSKRVRKKETDRKKEDRRRERERQRE